MPVVDKSRDLEYLFSNIDSMFSKAKAAREAEEARWKAEKSSSPMSLYHKGITQDLIQGPPEPTSPISISDKLTSIASRPMPSTPTPDMDSDGVPAAEDYLISAPSAKAISLQQEKSMLAPPAVLPQAPSSTALSKVSSSLSLKQAPKTQKVGGAIAGEDAAPVPYEEPNLFGTEMGDKALQQAQESRRYLDLLAGLGEAGATIGSAIAGTQAPKDLMAATRRAGEAGVSNILERRKGKLEEMTAKEAALKAKDLAEKSDPNSAISKMDRELVKEMAAGLGLPMQSWWDKAPSSQLENLKKNLETRAKHKQDSEDARIKREMLLLEKSKAADAKKDESVQKQTRKLGDVVQKLNEKQANEIGASQLMMHAADLAANGNENALTNVRKFVSKGVEGPSSRVTEADAKQHLVASFPRMVAERLSGILDGRLTDATNKELQQLGNAVIEAQDIKYKKLKYSAINMHMNIENIPKENRPELLAKFDMKPQAIAVVSRSDQAKVDAMMAQAAADGKNLTEEQAIKLLKVKTYADLK